MERQARADGGIRTMVLGQDYAYGHHAQEGHRRQDQAQTLADLLHADTRFPTGSRVLELGCGVVRKRSSCWRATRASS